MKEGLKNNQSLGLPYKEPFSGNLCCYHKIIHYPTHAMMSCPLNKRIYDLPIPLYQISWYGESKDSQMPLVKIPTSLDQGPMPPAS